MRRIICGFILTFVFLLALSSQCISASPVQVEVKWNPVIQDVDGNPVTVSGYRIYVAQTEGGLATAGVFREVTTTTDIISLECGPTYWIAVTAFLNQDESDKSLPVSIDLACPHHAPKAPDKPTATIVPETPVPPDPPPPPPTTAALTQTFDGPALPAGWEVIDDGTANSPSNWSISAGTLRQSTTINDGGASTSIPMLGSRYQFGGGQWYDFMLRAKINGKGGNVLGLVFRASNLNYYRFLESRILKFRRLQRVEDGSVVTLASDTMATFPENIWQSVEILIQGGHIVVAIDGSVVFDVTDQAPLPAGTVGAYVWNNAYSYFDDFIVESK